MVEAAPAKSSQNDPLVYHRAYTETVREELYQLVTKVQDAASRDL